MYIRTNAPHKKIKTESILKTFLIFYFSFSILFSLIFSFIKPFYFKKTYLGIFFINSSIVNFKVIKGDTVFISNNSNNNYLSILGSNLISFINIFNINKNNKNYKLYKIIALEGDRVYFKDGNFYVNDKAILNIKKDIFFEFDEIIIPKDCYFCLSIDSSDIFDSSIYGCFSFKDIGGKVIYKRFIKF
ncbi:MAG: S26 family signal peptidase [Spirochaetes bacterium]|nr:S26 family signal peptidase [Spirochaetota bacterium]